ncbi:hypothetical protein ACHAXR_011512 [Thalassiosira sp. AJA248-18]
MDFATKRPRSNMAVNYAFVAAACFVGTVAAFSPAPSTRSSFAARPQLRSIAAHSQSPRSIAASKKSNLPLSTSSRRRQHPPSPLRSSIEETFETEAAAKNETADEEQQHQYSVLGDTVTSTAWSNDPTAGSSPQQQLQQVLSSPDLLDPAAILDATIGITSEEDEVTLGELALSDAVVTDVTLPPSTATTMAPTLMEEDLELARQAIMEQISIGNGLVEDIEADEEKSLLAVDNLQAPSLIQPELTINNKLVEEQEPAATLSTATTKAKSILAAYPSIPKILRYTIPAIGIWLCSPVLSMIDTAAVGLLSGTAQQAALNPAVSVTDYGALVVAFMYTGTTNLIAAAVQEDNDNMDTISQPKTTATLITALKLALLVGSLFGIVIGTTGKPLLKLLIGNDTLDPTVFAAALRYVRIRSLGMPAMVVIGTAQSACLGMQDVKSPLYVLFAAAVVNFFGDVLLVPRAGSALFGGAAGAAWATVASQYAALLFFGRWLTVSVKPGGQDTTGDGKRGMNFFWKNRKNRRNEEDVDTNGNSSVVNVTQALAGTSKARQSKRKEFRKFLSSSKLSKRILLVASNHPSVMSVDRSNSNADKQIIRPIVQKKKKVSKLPKTRGYLANGKLSLRSYLSFSNNNFNSVKAKEFLPFVIPVTTTSIGRISGYIAMSHVASSTLGTYDMAGHQIIFSIFCCLAPVVDALSQVAQSFVPAIFEAKEKSAERAMALRKTISNFRKVGAGLGALLTCLVACIPLISRYFTTDPMVFNSVNSALPGVGLFLLVNGLMCAGEGTLLGQKDLKFLRNMYAIFFFTVPAYMLRLKHRSLAGLQTVGIGTMWTAFSTYNVIRTCIWHLRLAQLQRRTERGVEMEMMMEDAQ